MAHHHRRRMVEALDQQARLVPDGEAERPQRAGHVAAPQPRLGAVDQGRGDLGILRLEHAPLAGAGAHMLEHELVDLGGDPPDRPAVALGEEQTGLGMLEPGVGPGVEQPVHLGLQGRHPVRVVPVEGEGEVDEALRSEASSTARMVSSLMARTLAASAAPVTSPALALSLARR
jgi:hypothetical protein